MNNPTDATGTPSGTRARAHPQSLFRHDGCVVTRLLAANDIATVYERRTDVRGVGGGLPSVRENDRVAKETPSSDVTRFFPRGHRRRRFVPTEDTVAIVRSGRDATEIRSARKRNPLPVTVVHASSGPTSRRQGAFTLRRVVAIRARPTHTSVRRNPNAQRRLDGVENVRNNVPEPTRPATSGRSAAPRATRGSVLMRSDPFSRRVDFADGVRSDF